MSYRSAVCLRMLAGVAIGLLAPASTMADIDLTSRYAATLENSNEPVGYAWTCTADDAYTLRSFSIDCGSEDLNLTCRDAIVVFGVAQKNVVWAAIFPQQPGLLRTTLAGDGDKPLSIWLRFHPSRLGELFPAKTLAGPADAKYVRAARRLAAWKMGSSWQANNLPMIPTKNSIVVDVDTIPGIRRFYTIDSDKKSAEYVAAFESRRLPIDQSVTAGEAADAVQAVWAAFDREYAMFGIRPNVKWEENRSKAIVAASNARTAYDVAGIIAEMVKPLEDLHVWVRLKDEWIPCYDRERPLNANWKASDEIIGGVMDTRQNLALGKTRDGIGYLNIYALSAKQLPETFDKALQQLGETWGLIIDLRFNGGGDEMLARQIAGRFLDKPRLYSMNQYRSGPKHDDLGDKLARVAEPRGPWRYESPVVVLWGQKTMSSAESFALMLAQCPQVTTMGDRTAGASANPRQVDAGLGITVNLPRWLDLDPLGKPIDPDGIAPQKKIETTEKDFKAGRDPVLEAALDHLRTLPNEDRKPGKR